MCPQTRPKVDGVHDWGGMTVGWRPEMLGPFLGCAQDAGANAAACNAQPGMWNPGALWLPFHLESEKANIQPSSLELPDQRCHS